MVMKFNKRVYSNPKEVFDDLWFSIINVKAVRSANKLIPLKFRERLMMAVTEVNGCRYCSYFHTKQAFKSGISTKEINQMFSGDFDACPEDELVAIIYAQHWAENKAKPNPEAVRKLMETYGVKKSEAIELVLRMIQTGNLLGNSFDYMIYRISRGRWGK
jgi:AhpD family alkylhydroperoxidase